MDYREWRKGLEDVKKREWTKDGGQLEVKKAIGGDTIRQKIG